MEKAQLDALLVAHGGRAQPVASLHVLRARLPGAGARELAADNQAFLVKHAGVLATLNLSRWLGRAGPAQRSAVVDALIDLAKREPQRFEIEIARAPHSELSEAERSEIAVRLLGHVPEGVVAALLPPPAADPPVKPAAADTRQIGFSIRGTSSQEMDFGSGETSFRQAGFLKAAERLSFQAAPRRAKIGLGGANIFGGEDLLGGVDFEPLGGAAAAKRPRLEALLQALSAAKKPRSRRAALTAAKAKTAKTKGARKAKPRFRPSEAWKEQAILAAGDTSEDWSTEVPRLPKRCTTPP